MKKFLFFALMLMSSFSFAQNAPIDFEVGGKGADWEWTSLTDNATIDPELEMVENPFSTGINTTAKVAKFTATDASKDYALCHSDGIASFTFDANNSTVKIMVYKTVISNVGVKFEGASPAKEILKANTKINEWEELTFDFSSVQGNTYSKIVLIPDFAPRDQDNIVYMDNITFSSGQLVLTPLQTINFEATGIGANWDWTMAANGDNPALEFIDNPYATGINTSAKVAKFSVRDAGDAWALCHSDGIGSFKMDATTKIVKIMVWKNRISDVGVKFEGTTVLELKVPNTKTGEWEELTFDFSALVGVIETKIVIIPDFAERAADDVVYFDNISFTDGTISTIANAPIENISIFAAEGVLNVNCPEDLFNGKIEVFNLTGQIISSKNIFSANEQLSIEKGFYIVKISDQNNKQVASQKVFAN